MHVSLCRVAGTRQGQRGGGTYERTIQHSRPQNAGLNGSESPGERREVFM